MKDQAPTPDMMGIMYEKRALKRPRLGPPDVYPQEPRQKEDELTSTNVKHGFPTTPHLTDEFGTARNYNVTASKVGAYFNSILAKKEELSTLPDCGRKRQQINPKDNFWPATARTKGAIEAWFKDLAGSKPLAQLAKKAPNFNKKEEIFMSLTEHQVALPRAAWFIKLSSAYTVAVSEAKIKKRQLPDPTTEWTSTLIKFLKDQIPKLTEYYQNTNQGAVPDKTPPSQSGQTTPSHSSSASGGTTPNSNTVPHPMHSPANISGSGGGPICDTGDGKQALRQWTYCVRLAKYLMEEALLERHDFLTWLVDLVDKRTPDDPLLKLFLSLVLQHMGEITQCELLARRLCHSAARKAAAICATLSDHALRQLTQPPGADSPTPAAALSPVADQIISTIVDTKPPSVLPVVIKRSTTPAGEAPAPATPPATKQLHPVQASFGEILSCPFHKDVIVQLATVLQITCVECPAALVWSGVGEPRSALQGSPLDLLPVPPSSLPMPAMQSHLTATHRRQVYEAEQEISARSKKAESKWCTDKWQTSSQDSETFRLDCGNEKKSLKIAVTFR